MAKMANVQRLCYYAIQAQGQKKYTKDRQETIANACTERNQNGIRDIISITILYNTLLFKIVLIIITICSSFQC